MIGYVQQITVLSEQFTKTNFSQMKITYVCNINELNTQKLQ